MPITARKKGNKKVVKLSGEVTIFEISEMWNKFQPILHDEKEIEVDLSAVSVIDTAGVQLLMMAKKVCQQDDSKQIQLVKHSEAVIDGFELFDLSGYFGDPMVLESDKGGK